MQLAIEERGHAVNKSNASAVRLGVKLLAVCKGVQISVTMSCLSISLSDYSRCSCLILLLAFLWLEHSK